MNKILDSLYNLEDIRYFEERYKQLEGSVQELSERYSESIGELSERVGTSLKQVLDAYSNYLSLLKKIWDNANAMEKTEFVAWLNDCADEFDSAIRPLDDILGSWPEYISSTKKEDNNGNNTQI